MNYTTGEGRARVARWSDAPRGSTSRPRDPTTTSLPNDGAGEERDPKQTSAGARRERTGLTVEVFTRGSMDARSHAESVVNSLLDLAESGRISGVDVHAWPGEMSLDSRSLEGVVERFERFEAWARERDVSIRPPFSVRVRRSTITGESDTLLVTPVLCLAAYDGDEVVGVYPCTDGNSVTSIDDFIERLAEAGGTPSGPPPGAPRDRPADSGRGTR